MHLLNMTEDEYCPEINVSAIAGSLVGAGVVFILAAAICNIHLLKVCAKTQ